MKLFGIFFFAATFVAETAVFTATPEEEVAFRKRLQDSADLTIGKSDICPVHKVKMTARHVPIQFGLTDREIQEKNGFPFSEEVICAGGLVIDDPQFPKSGKVFVCPKCVEARNRWFGKTQKRWEQRRLEQDKRQQGTPPTRRAD